MLTSLEEDNLPAVDDIDGHAKPNLETSKSLSLEEKEEEGKLKHRDSLEKLQLQYQRMMSRNSQMKERKVSNVAESEEAKEDINTV